MEVSANPFEFKCEFFDICGFATSHRAKLNFHKTKCKYCIAAAEEEEPARKRRRRRRTPARRSSKGEKDTEGKKPRWNAYLVWFTQEGNKIREAEPDIPFGDVGKRLKGKWQQVRWVYYWSFCTMKSIMNGTFLMMQLAAGRS